MKRAALLPRLHIGESLAWAAAFVTFGLSLVNPYFLNMFWQIPDGNEILHGHLPRTVSYALDSGPLVPQEWLFEAAIAWFGQHGAYGVFVLLCAAAAAATPLLVYALVRAAGVVDLAAGIAAFLTVGARFAGSAIRPETFAVDAFALELLVLFRGRRVWLLLPIVALWANVHASAVLAPVAALLYAAGERLARRRFDGRVVRATASALLALLGTLLTPNGFRIWTYAFALAIAPNPAREHLDAWRPLTFGFAGAVAGVLPGLVILLLFGAVLARRRLGELFVAALCFLMTLTHARYTTFLAVGWAAVLARALEQRLNLDVLAIRLKKSPALALLPLAVYAAWDVPRTLRTPVDPPGPWQAAARLAEEHHLHGNAYATYTWAAYLHWRGLPLRLLIDAHGDAFPAEVWDDHLALEGLHANWRSVLERRKIRTVIVPVDTPLAQALLLEPHWRSAGRRQGIVAFVRR